ncbi:mitochondrial PGP phosphatase [Kalaharituber pfeilii]|nr:mitochondrial PGP phosphatase [Kalaharituber pfeilii]
MGFNLSATLNALRALKSPTLLLPHGTVSSFDQIPYPLSSAFAHVSPDGKPPDIRAVVLDKDNCFAIPHHLEVYGQYKNRFEQLKKEYPGNKLLIVSNSSGTRDDPGNATTLEKALGVKVLHHATKKPGCHSTIMSHFTADPTTGVTSPAQVAIVGDRLFTDIMMANMMGSWGIWVQDGVDVGKKSMFGGMERMLETWMRSRGLRAPVPVTRE